MPVPDPLRSGSAKIAVCDRCGQVVVAPDSCICATPHDVLAARRRLSKALAKGRRRREVERDAARRRVPPAS